MLIIIKNDSIIPLSVKKTTQKEQNFPKKLHYFSKQFSHIDKGKFRCYKEVKSAKKGFKIKENNKIMALRIEEMTIPGAPVEGLGTLPVFHSRKPVVVETKEDFPERLKEGLGARWRFLPYKLQNRYGREHIQLKKKTIVLENEYLKAEFWPEEGAKLNSLFDKVRNRELLMSNPVYQPGNLAIRNAWCAGGIEWNFGNLGHNPFTCDHVFAAVLKDDKGEDFVRFYEFERTKTALYQMDFYLPEGSPVLYAHVKLINPTDQDKTTYWWTNIAIPEVGNTRVMSNADMVVGIGKGGLGYEKMPYLSYFKGKDLSYPDNADLAFEYFFQTPAEEKSAWEAGTAQDGNLFFERGTTPLLYRKMFCWGNTQGGKHWQDQLSLPGKGYYVEIQSGIASSQLHDRKFKAREVIEWTQCFGGMKLEEELLHQEDYHAAARYVGEHVEKALSEETLLAMDAKFKVLSNKEVTEKDIVHMASGWGALEQARLERTMDGEFPKSVCFPKSTIGPEQNPWYQLLTEGKMPEEDPATIPVSWMVSEPWLKIMEEALAKGEASWNMLFHYGVMLYEKMDEENYVPEASCWPEYEKYAELAKEAFLKSIEIQPSVWAYRCLFCIERDRENKELAETYYDKVFEMKAATVDYELAAEYIKFLNDCGKYEKACALYESLPANIQNEERMLIRMAQTAIKIDRLDLAEKAFTRDYANIKEGESTLTTIWFEYCARKMAKERGIENPTAEQLEKLIDEAWDICPPPKNIDFRMSTDKKRRYRMEN